MPIIILDNSLPFKDFSMKENPENIRNLYKNDKTLLVSVSTEKPLYKSDNIVKAIYAAYNSHCGIRLSPDDILHCFTYVACHCLNVNAEKFRDVFVNHEGKETLTIYTNTMGDQGNWDWNRLSNSMSELIEEKARTTLDLKSDFSTSNETTKGVASLMNMCAFKEYYNFRMCALCGIRKVDLTGTLDDWLRLKEKIIKCANMFTERGHMVNWSKHFITVVDRLIETYQSYIPDKEPYWLIRLFSKSFNLPDYLKRFWSRIITYIPYGSGGDVLTSGWVQVLSPGSHYEEFPQELNLLSSESIPDKRNDKEDYYDWQTRFAEWAQVCKNIKPSFSTVNVIVNDYGKIYDTTTTIGFIGFSIDNDFIVPEVGYFTHAIPKN